MQKNVGSEGETEARVSTSYVFSVTLTSVAHTLLQLDTGICTDHAEDDQSELRLRLHEHYLVRTDVILLGCLSLHTTCFVVLVVLMYTLAIWQVYFFVYLRQQNGQFSMLKSFKLVLIL